MAQPSLGLLGRLPAELRNRVYEEVLVCEQPIAVVASDCKSTIEPCQIPFPVNVGFLRTSKILYTEARSVFYGANHFELRTTPISRLSQIVQFLKSTTWMHETLRNITIDIGKLDEAMLMDECLYRMKRYLGIVKTHTDRHPKCDLSVVFSLPSGPAADQAVRFTFRPTSEASMKKSVADFAAGISQVRAGLAEQGARLRSAGDIAGMFRASMTQMEVEELSKTLKRVLREYIEKMALG